MATFLLIANKSQTKQNGLAKLRTKCVDKRNVNRIVNSYKKTDLSKFKNTY